MRRDVQGIQSGGQQQFGHRMYASFACSQQPLPTEVESLRS